MKKYLVQLPERSVWMHSMLPFHSDNSSDAIERRRNKLICRGLEKIWQKIRLRQPKPSLVAQCKAHENDVSVA